jgi:flagellar basal-body rod protein FlgF
MDTTSPVGVSGQIALMRRLETIANNVANAGTVGFRGEAVTFSTIVSETKPFRTSFAFGGGPHVNTASGGFVRTGNPLDVAVKGEAYLAISTPEGTAYTRDGRMQILPTGDLVSLAGHPILDPSGTPLTLDPRGGAPEIGADGTIIQDGRNAGAIGLYGVDFSKGYNRFENASFIPVSAPVPVEDFTVNAIVQGFTEQSNVNPVTEITRLISVQRAFEAMSSSLEQRDQAIRETIQALGARSS